MRRKASTFLIASLALLTCVDAGAQDFDIRGATERTNWPDKSLLESDDSAYNLLPFIESLRVRYQFGEIQRREGPSADLRVSWRVGEGGILDGVRVGRDELPEGMLIDDLDLVLPVMVDGRQVAEFNVSLAGIGLGPEPAETRLEVAEIPWDSTFVGQTEGQARALFDSGFELGPPRIVRIVFVVDPIMSRNGDVPDARRRDPHYRTHRTVVIPDMNVWFVWRDGPIFWRPRRHMVRTVKPRDAEAGRSDSGRSAIRRVLDDVADEDDDDEDRLYPAAIAGAAAVVGLAVAGGTIGVYGSVDKAPIGLMAGFVRDHGGALIHVSINEQVFGKAEGPENLIAGITGFYDIFSAPVAPAFGVGVRATEEGTDGVAYRPTASFGFVGVFNRVVLVAAYDVVTPDMRVGIGVNFRKRND